MTARPSRAKATSKVALSTASVYPESTTAAFEIAAKLGFDGLEVMDLSTIERENLDLKARLARYEDPTPTPVEVKLVEKFAAVVASSTPCAALIQ